MDDGESPDLVYLSDQWKWFGQHTGYSLVTRPEGAEGRAPGVIRCSNRGLLAGMESRLYAMAHRGAWCCAGRDSAAERAFLAKWRGSPRSIGHVLFFERHHPIFHFFDRAPARLIATIHHPPAQMDQWHPEVKDDLRRLSSAIVLYQRDLEFFERHVGPGRVRFIRHGVDAEFFQPGADGEARPQRLLFSGVNGRNLAMLERVVLRLCRSHPALRFDFLLPRFQDKPNEVLRLRGLWHHPRIQWHSGLSDEALRTLYQTSYLLLLPLDHAGACTAIVEALACGLPVVTTDVGGVRDYGAGSIFPVVDNNDDDAMVDLIVSYLDRPALRRETALCCRRFAEQALSWPFIRRCHLEAYRALSGGA